MHCLGQPLKLKLLMFLLVQDIAETFLISVDMVYIIRRSSQVVNCQSEVVNISVVAADRKQLANWSPYLAAHPLPE